MSDKEIRDLEGDVNRLTSFLNSPRYLQAAKMVEYLNQSDNMLSEKASLFAHNDKTKAARANLVKAMEVCVKHMVDTKQTPPALKNVGTTNVTKSITDDDIRTLKGDVNRLSSFMDRPQYLQPAKINEYLTQSDNMLSEKSAEFDHSADTKAARAQLIKSMEVCIKHLVAAKQTPPALKNVSTTPSGPREVSDMDIRSLKGDVNRLSSFLDHPDRLPESQILGYVSQAETLLKEKADIFAHNADTQAAKAQLEKSIATSKGDVQKAQARAATDKAVATGAPVAPKSSLDDQEIRGFIGDCNRWNSFMSNPIQIMEDSGPEKLQWYIDEAEKSLKKVTGQENHEKIAKYYQDLTNNRNKCIEELKTHGPKYAAHMEERYALEQAAQNWSMREKNVGLKNEDSVVYQFNIEAGTMSTKTNANARITMMNFCCTGDKITLLATKQSLIVPDGCTQIVIKNKVMSTK